MALSKIENDIRMALVGKTGAGKSALGNSLLRRHHFDSNAMARSVTSQCKFAHGNLRDGTKLCIVDTPGIFDTSKANEETRMEIVKCIGLSSPGPHVFLFVLSISRFTKEELDTVNNLVAAFGEDVIKHVVIVFTGKDSLTYDGITLADYLQNVPPELSELVQRCSSRYATIDNRADDAEVQADIDCIINVVRKTIRENGGSYYTGEMYKAAEEALQERMRLIDEKKHNEKRELQMRLDEFEQRKREIEDSAIIAREHEHEKQRLEADLATPRVREFKERSEKPEQFAIRQTQKQENEKQRLETELAASRERGFKRRFEEYEQRLRDIEEYVKRQTQEHEREKQMLETKLAALINSDTRQQVRTEVEDSGTIVETIALMIKFLPTVTTRCNIS